MTNVGTIGTSEITKTFLKACIASRAFKISHLYSRTTAKAQALIDEFFIPEATADDDLTKFLSAPDLDVVYVASPNSMHFSHVKAALEHGKSVIVEKPAFVTPAEYQAIDAILQQHPELHVIEGARHLYDANYLAATEKVRQFNEITGATLAYMKYSSRFDAFQAGQNPNIFSPKFAGGALYDLGVYLVYAAVDWFGEPLSCDYHATKADNDIDLHGLARLHYEKFDVALIFGKDQQSFLPSEVYSHRQTLWLDNLGTPARVRLYDSPAVYTDLSQHAAENPLYDEVSAISQMFTNREDERFDHYWQLTGQVNHVLDQLRHSAGIVFESEQN
ncbi:Gfo/Idh/MocA family protein [Lapidilactobacillus gannanensis]|uniref:Gfo/Idh/MocA family protein n=1 Tax=Lapidilactobacillus gannanensis TaxID=2486002 RepID=A0ABW4BN21_9LACO|nr:Gfo/Idh/MocA family oxidoreductase [Lapidilactobacillus gannanensis]